MEAFRFHTWLWLLLIPVVPLIQWLLTAKRTKPAAVFSSIADLKRIPKTFAQRIRRLFPSLVSLGLVLIVVGLARPQSGKSDTRIHGEGIAIELVLDISGSMEALDFQLEGKDVSRLTAVKKVISDFVMGSSGSGLAGRKDDVVGLVAFGGFADSKCPLTMDHGALVDIVKGLEIPKPIRDRRGNVLNSQALQEELATAIGDGVALGIDRLRDAKAKSKIMILLTDGDNNAGVIDPRESASIAKELGIRIYTVGIGRNGLVPMPQEDEFGRRVLVPMEFRTDEALLKEISTTTGGIHLNASNAEGLVDVYAQIDKMEKSQFEETRYAQYTELFHWFAGPGLALLVLVHFMNETRFRSLP